MNLFESTKKNRNNKMQKRYDKNINNENIEEFTNRIITK
jgi:hypothetical protein